MDYVHINPLKHGHVTRVADWPYSTFHRYVASGVYPLDWCGSVERRQEGLKSASLPVRSNEIVHLHFTTRIF